MRLIAVAAGVAASLAAWPAGAEVDLAEQGSLGLDLGVGAVITDYNSTSSNGGGLLLTGLRYDYDLAGPYVLEVVLRQWWLPGSEHATMPGLGLRYEAFRNELGRAYADLALGPTWTSHTWTFGFDAGAGFDFDVGDAPGFALGPFVRYGQVVNPDSRSSNDGHAWSLGVSFLFHIGPAQAAAASRKARDPGPIRPFVYHLPDTDHDGFTDDVDQCPQVPAGRHRDPYRPGCPENDEDGDGVPDDVDPCPVTPPGDHPDPKRLGCPVSDADKDGIPDGEDRCPDKAGPASDDASKNGCPVARKPAEDAEKAAPADVPMPEPMKTRKRSLRDNGPAR